MVTETDSSLGINFIFVHETKVSVVTEVISGGLAETLGMKPGDVLLDKKGTALQQPQLVDMMKSMSRPFSLSFGKMPSTDEKEEVVVKSGDDAKSEEKAAEDIVLKSGDDAKTEEEAAADKEKNSDTPSFDAGFGDDAKTEEEAAADEEKNSDTPSFDAGFGDDAKTEEEAAANKEEANTTEKKSAPKKKSDTKKKSASFIESILFIADMFNLFQDLSICLDSTGTQKEG